MTLYTLSLLAFMMVNLLPVFPNLKDRLKSQVGRAYGPIFGFASLAILVVVIIAYRSAGHVDFYEPPSWGSAANFVLTFVAFQFFGIAAFRGSWRKLIGFPLAWGTFFWAAGHLLANGDLATLMLVAGVLLIAVAHIALRYTSTSPEMPVRAGHNLMGVLFGVAFYGIFAQAHGAIIGVPVLNLLQ